MSLNAIIEVEIEVVGDALRRLPRFLPTSLISLTTAGLVCLDTRQERNFVEFAVSFSVSSLSLSCYNYYCSNSVILMTSVILIVITSASSKC